MLIIDDRILSTIQIGETIHVNHDDCPAGADTKRRLYLTRPAGSNSVVLAYCHNCGDGDVFKLDRYRKDIEGEFDNKIPLMHKFTQDESQNQGDLQKVLGKMKGLDEWPTAAVNWRIAKSVSTSMIEDIKIKYDPATHRIVTPVWEHIVVLDVLGGGVNSVLSPINLRGLQYRRLSNNKDEPKYLTTKVDQSKDLFTIIQYTPDELKNMPIYGIVVEDLASGLQVARSMFGYDKNYKVLVLYGVQVKPEALRELDGVSSVTIWLDNDGDHVKQQAKTIGRVSSMILNRPVSIITEASDPKYYTAGDINDKIMRSVNRG